MAGIVILCAALVVVSILIFQSGLQANGEMEPYREIVNTAKTEIQANKPEQKENDDFGIDFDALLNINPNTVGWLTNHALVDYPVVVSQDSQYYLSHDFYGDYNRAGTLFIYSDEKPWKQGASTVIYGHNMGNGREDMFSSLLSYKDEAYFQSYPVFRFDTVHGKGNYRIFAAFQLDTREGYDYLQTEFENEAAFLRFVGTAMDKTPYSCGVTPAYGDPVIVLSTCDRSVDPYYGRYIIMAAMTG